MTESIHLPEGSEVYVVIPGVVDERLARRKANRWLVENVGNMVMADTATLNRANGEGVWRFGAFVTGLLHPPYGPLGYVDVNVTTGEVLADEQIAAEMIHNGENL